MRLKLKNEQYIWGLLRISLGLIFLWAFLDKLFGLGLSTMPANSWINGGSPTSGFLLNSTKGPAAGLFQVLAHYPLVDWLFMLGVLFIGMALILGIGVQIAGYSGAGMVFLMWLAVLPPENNPFLDQHIIYAIVLIGLTQVKSGHWLGLGSWWSKTRLVKENKFLR